MTTPTEEFDLTTAKTIAADIIERELCTGDDMGPIEELHTRIFTTLGDDPDKAAAKLEQLGVKGALPAVVRDGAEIYGDLEDEENGPLSVLLRDVCGASSASLAGDYGMIYWETPGGDEIGHESVELPKVLAEFQRRYNDFAYPALYTEPVPQDVIDYQTSPVKGIERMPHTVRGPVRQVDNRDHAAPMPDDLVAEISAAGLTADDFGDVIEISRNGQLWAMVRGTDVGGGSWHGQYGLRLELSPLHAYQDLQLFDNRDDAVRHVVRNVNTPRIVPVKLPDGRWRRGPLTGPTDYKRIADRVLIAAMTAGLTLDQPGKSELSAVDVYRDGEKLAHTEMVNGGTWQANLTDGRVLAERNLDAILLTTIEALTAS